MLISAVVAANAGRSGTQAPPAKQFTIAPIEAEFIPKNRLTQYSAPASGTREILKFTWTLHLKLVDPAGESAPASPGSGAAVDLGCDNAGNGLPRQPYVAKFGEHTRVYFTWNHPDPVDSVPPHKYHCNHLDMGPHGHQGLITVVVQGSNWECSASYKGTNSTASDPRPGATPTAADIAASVKNGTASTPKCSPIH
jgi:hypothetical protein